jgi:hypothetical protein
MISRKQYVTEITKWMEVNMVLSFPSLQMFLIVVFFCLLSLKALDNEFKNNFNLEIKLSKINFFFIHAVLFYNILTEMNL